METAAVKTRLALAKRPLWSYDEISAWFGIELGGVSQQFEGQFAVWGEKYRARAVLAEPGKVNRFYLELFLQSRELVPVRFAAVELGMDVKSFREMLDAARDRGLVSKAEAEGEFPGIYRQTLVRDFHKRFDVLKGMLFLTHSGFVSMLHGQISDVLGVTVTALSCIASQAMGDSPPDYARSFDIITDDPIGNRYQVWLETGKPIQLRPDACSYLTYLRHEAALRGNTYGREDPLSAEDREALRKYVGSDNAVL